MLIYYLKAVFFLGQTMDFYLKSCRAQHVDMKHYDLLCLLFGALQLIYTVLVGANMGDTCGFMLTHILSFDLLRTLKLICARFISKPKQTHPSCGL